MKQLEAKARLWHIAAARISDARQIIDFRNQLVHNYPGIDPLTVWGILQQDVPVLLREVRELLDE